MDELIKLLLLFSAGFMASFVNMMAGGGSMLTIGALILIGVEPIIANGTNRIGVLFGTGAGAITYRAEKFTDIRTSLTLGICAIPGAIAGSLFSVHLGNEWFQKILGMVMIFIVLTMFLPQKSITARAQAIGKSWLIYPAMILIGFYGGFIQVGVGFIIMAVLRHLLSFDLLRVNMHKIFIVLIYTLPVLLIFGLNGKIDYLYAIIMSLGNALGSYISVKLALRRGEKLVKAVLIFAVILMAIKMLV
ncbi:sulfite exporter TauE/SafE family protein [Roseimarinus sediminis]|uniref:sulfite exporter TauE/SafE family protein n=1 Tax=Roseimarinus sediminis TaxID=1610899 RepID=UPI003D20B807